MSCVASLCRLSVLLLMPGVLFAKGASSTADLGPFVYSTQISATNGAIATQSESGSSPNSIEVQDPVISGIGLGGSLIVDNEMTANGPAAGSSATLIYDGDSILDTEINLISTVSFDLGAFGGPAQSQVRITGNGIGGAYGSIIEQLSQAVVRTTGTISVYSTNQNGGIDELVWETYVFSDSTSTPIDEIFTINTSQLYRVVIQSAASVILVNTSDFNLQSYMFLGSTQFTSETSGAAVYVSGESGPVPPQVSIDGGDRTIVDSDGKAGETVGLAATASDSDGTVESVEWLIDGNVVATGLMPAIFLPDGLTVVTARATDNDGISSTDSVSITVETWPEDGWPSPYNGVIPDSEMGLTFNNIGVFSDDDQLLYVCIRIFENGEPASIDGIDKWGLAFDNFAASDGSIRLFNARKFNQWDYLDENQESPDCSGEFELSTGTYTDIIKVGVNTYSVIYELEDPVNLVFRETDRILLHSELPPAQPASFDGSMLIVPAVRVGTATFSLTMSLLAGSDPIEFSVSTAEEAADVGLGASSFENNVLFIPSLEIGGIDYYVELLLVIGNPFSFQLVGAGPN